MVYKDDPGVHLATVFVMLDGTFRKYNQKNSGNVY